MRKYKCYGTCGEKYTKDNLIIHSNKNYCKQCYEKVTKDNDDRVILYNLIKKHYNVTFPTSMHLAQIKKVKENGYTYEDMILGLRYCIDVLRLKLNGKMGFGYVSNNIEAAKQYYKEQEQKAAIVENIFADNIFTDTFTTSTVVKVAKLDNTNTLRQSKMINLEDIL